MSRLPYLFDSQDAITYYRETPSMTDAARAYVVRTLALDGYTNSRIRETLGIEKVYTVTHLKRTGCALTEDQLRLWDKNSATITLGHVRAIAKLPSQRIEEILRKVISHKLSVRHVIDLAKGKDVEPTNDIKAFQEEVSEAIGRPVKVRYSESTCCGSIVLDFYGLDDLDNITKALGYTREEPI